jgi:hypothetical protein
MNALDAAKHEQEGQQLEARMPRFLGDVEDNREEKRSCRCWAIRLTAAQS